jgi:hypothetical protein
VRNAWACFMVGIQRFIMVILKRICNVFRPVGYSTSSNTCCARWCEEHMSLPLDWLTDLQQSLNLPVYYIFIRLLLCNLPIFSFFLTRPFIKYAEILTLTDKQIEIKQLVQDLYKPFLNYCPEMNILPNIRCYFEMMVSC